MVIPRSFRSKIAPHTVGNGKTPEAITERTEATEVTDYSGLNLPVDRDSTEVSSPELIEQNGVLKSSVQPSKYYDADQVLCYSSKWLI